MILAAEKQQVFGNSLFDLGIAGQRPAHVHGQALGSLHLGHPVVPNALVHNYSGSFLCQ